MNSGFWSAEIPTPQPRPYFDENLPASRSCARYAPTASGNLEASTSLTIPGTHPVPTDRRKTGQPETADRDWPNELLSRISTLAK